MPSILHLHIFGTITKAGKQMRTKELFGITMLFLYVFCFIGCSNEDEVFHSLSMDVDGIELTKEKKSEIYWGGAPADRMKFTITGKGKYADLTYITSVCIDGVSQIQKNDQGKREPVDEYSVWEGEWGYIKYQTKLPPYCMQFELAPNTSDKKRFYEFQLGYGYWHAIVKIIQKSR